MARNVVKQARIDDGLAYLINKRQPTCDVSCFGLCINRCSDCTLANCAVDGKLDLCRVGTVNRGNLVLSNLTIDGELITRSSGGNLFDLIFGNVTLNTINGTGSMKVNTLNGRATVLGGNLVVRNVIVDGNITIGATVPEGDCPGTLPNSVSLFGGGTINCSKCPYGCAGLSLVNGVISASCALPFGCECRAYCGNCG